jgi:hypothetical protein
LRHYSLVAWYVLKVVLTFVIVALKVEMIVRVVFLKAEMGAATVEKVALKVVKFELKVVSEAS